MTLRARRSGTCTTEDGRTRQRFPAEYDAEIALEQVRALRLRRDPATLRIERSYYRCNRCSGWHLSCKP